MTQVSNSFVAGTRQVQASQEFMFRGRNTHNALTQWHLQSFKADIRISSNMIYHICNQDFTKQRYTYITTNAERSCQKCQSCKTQHNYISTQTSKARPKSKATENLSEKTDKHTLHRREALLFKIILFGG